MVTLWRAVRKAGILVGEPLTTVEGMCSVEGLPRL